MHIKIWAQKPFFAYEWDIRKMYDIFANDINILYKSIKSIHFNHQKAYRNIASAVLKR